MEKMRHQSLIFIKYKCVKLAFTFVRIKKHTVYDFMYDALGKSIIGTTFRAFDSIKFCVLTYTLI